MHKIHNKMMTQLCMDGMYVFIYVCVRVWMYVFAHISCSNISGIWCLRMRIGGYQSVWRRKILKICPIDPRWKLCCGLFTLNALETSIFFFPFKRVLERFHLVFHLVQCCERFVRVSWLDRRYNRTDKSNTEGPGKDESMARVFIVSVQFKKI